MYRYLQWKAQRPNDDCMHIVVFFFNIQPDNCSYVVNGIEPHRTTPHTHSMHFFEIIGTEWNSRQIDEMSNDVLFIFLFVTTSVEKSMCSCVYISVAYVECLAISSVIGTFLLLLPSSCRPTKEILQRQFAFCAQKHFSLLHFFFFFHCLDMWMCGTLTRKLPYFFFGSLMVISSAGKTNTAQKKTSKNKMCSSILYLVTQIIPLGQAD